MRNVNVEFQETPESAKKFGVKWLKWNIIKYPHISLIVALTPLTLATFAYRVISIKRATNNGEFVPNVLLHTYQVVRPDSWWVEQTPKRYRN